jgi:hypothetical protein
MGTGLRRQVGKNDRGKVCAGFVLELDGSLGTGIANRVSPCHRFGTYTLTCHRVSHFLQNSTIQKNCGAKYCEQIDARAPACYTVCSRYYPPCDVSLKYPLQCQ